MFVTVLFFLALFVECPQQDSRFGIAEAEYPSALDSKPRGLVSRCGTWIDPNETGPERIRRYLRMQP